MFLYLFDVMVVDGHDVSRLPLRTRKRLLRDAVDFDDPIRFSAHRDHPAPRCVTQRDAIRGDALHFRSARLSRG